jgi:hypothetical protein
LRLLGLAEVVELNVVEKHFESVAYTAELPPITPDVLEDCLLHLGMGCLAEVDVDKPELRPLLKKSPRIDCLPELFRR